MAPVKLEGQPRPKYLEQRTSQDRVSKIRAATSSLFCLLTLPRPYMRKGNDEEPDQLVKSMCVETTHIYSSFSFTFEEVMLSFGEEAP